MAGRKYLEGVPGWAKTKLGAFDLLRGVRFWFQRRKYGFDVRDTWNLDWTMLELAYERIRMFDSVAAVSSDSPVVSFGGVEMSLKEVVFELSALAESALSGEPFEREMKETRFWELWAVSHKHFGGERRLCCC